MSNIFEDDLKQKLKDTEFAKAFGAARAKSSFAWALVIARTRLGLTQKELAAKAGVPQAYIAKLEEGEADPTLGRIGRLLAVMGLTLITGTTTQNPFDKV